MTDQIQAEKHEALVKQEALDMNRDPITGAPGSHPLGTGVGAVSGAAAGAALGSVTGPLGTAIGGVVGAVVGGLAGKGIGEAANPSVEVVDRAGDPVAVRGAVVAPLDPTAEDLYWQRAFVTEPYYNSELSYDDYAPAYRAGSLDRRNHAKRTWEESETVLQSEWERSKGTSRLSWEDAKDPVQAAWQRADNELSGADPYFGVN